MADQPAPRTNLEAALRTYCATEHRTQSDVAAQLGINERTLRRLASGERKARATTARALEALFGLSSDVLLAWFSDDVSGAAEPVDETADTLQTLRRRADAFAAARTPVHETELTALSDTVRQLTTDYLSRPSTVILSDLADAQARIIHRLDARPRPSDERRLYFLGGIVAGLIANAYHDLTNPHSALTHANMASLCADYAENGQLAAWAHGLKSLISYRAALGSTGTDAVRHLSRAADEARRGAEFRRDTDHTSLAPWLALNEARAWGRLGDAKQARHAIDHAADARARQEENEFDRIGGACSCSTLEQAYYSGDALIWLPSENDAAEEYCETAARRYREAFRSEDRTAWDFGCHACAHLNLAITKVRRGDLDAAVLAAEQVLGIPRDHRITGIVQSARHLRSVLAGSTLAHEGAELHEALSRFVADPARSAHVRTTAGASE